MPDTTIAGQVAITGSLAANRLHGEREQFPKVIIEVECGEGRR
jgi:hypothetical protein